MGKCISEMKNKKSSWPDEISNQLLKLASPDITGSLIYIFNLCIEQNVFPSEFQKAKVIPLAKTRDHKNLNDWGPISLLSLLSRLLDRHVHKHLVTYLETRDLFHPLQSGFSRKHSCNTALARSTDSSRLFPDASLVRASARESRSATQVAPLEISDSWAVRPRTHCCCQQ